MANKFSGDAMLQQYAQDAALANVQRIADFLAPTVEVAVQSGRFWIHDKETPLRIPDTRRGLGGKATQVIFSEGKGQFDCEPRALDTPLDELEIKEADSNGYTSIVRERADVLAWMGGLSHEQNVLDIAAKSLGSGTAADWGANSDPIADLSDVLFDLVKNILGGSSMDLRMLVGAEVWKRLHRHPSLLDRIPNGATSSNKKGVKTVTLEDFGKMLSLEAKTRVSLGVYNAAKEGQDANMQWMFGSGITVFAAKEAPNRLDPSFMKTFRLMNYWMKLGEYEKEDGRGKVLKFDWSADPKVANADAGKMIVPTF